jgi:hypothetical protein
MSDYPRDAQDAVELEASKRAAMTDTRYSAEELRDNIDKGFDDPPNRETFHHSVRTNEMLRQAARDAETLAGIRAWLDGGVQQGCSCEWCSLRRRTLAELDRLSRGDAEPKAGRR